MFFRSWLSVGTLRQVFELCGHGSVPSPSHADLTAVTVFVRIGLYKSPVP